MNPVGGGDSAFSVGAADSNTPQILPPSKQPPSFASLLDLVSLLPRLVYRALRFHWGCPESALRQRVTGPRGRSPHS